MMKTKINKILIISMAALAVAVVALAIRFTLGGPEDSWICSDGQWVKHGNPSVSQPDTLCGNSGEIIEPKIVVTAPRQNQIISGPFEISGKAKTWYFEGSFPVSLVDSQNNKIAAGYAKAMGEWMTAEYVPFQLGDMKFLSYPKATTSGFVVFQKDNPSDMRELDEEFRVPVTIAPMQTVKVKLYFNNNKLDPEISCNKVFPAEREIIKTQALARAAVEELLKGPSQTEIEQGFSTIINYGVKIQSLVIENNIARIDFNETLDNPGGGSCRVSAIRAQITQTLKQFSSVKDVIISINGETETILQP
ncbi:MAG: GerMN domain-containing protein [Candidatus Pacebacteria bacterium]|nr:GerMN domain-containing protein [Candidatus Paceibacterota bacterium]